VFSGTEKNDILRKRHSRKKKPGREFGIGIKKRSAAELHGDTKRETSKETKKKGENLKETRNLREDTSTRKGMLTSLTGTNMSPKGKNPGGSEKEKRLIRDR